MHRMKKLAFPLLVSLAMLLAGSSFAKDEAAAGRCTPRVPVVDIDRALQLALQELQRHHEPPQNFFIDAITLQCVDGRAFWQVGWRRKAYESGQLVMRIYMDSTVEESVIKDR